MTALPVVPSVRAVRDVVRRLAAIVPGSHRVVSCYLKLEPRDKTRGKYLIKMKNRIREALALLEGQTLDRAVRDAVAADLERVARFFEVPAFDVAELPGLMAEATRPGKFHGERQAKKGTVLAGGYGEHNYNMRIRQEKQRHYANVADHIYQIQNQRPLAGIVVAGIGVDAAALVPHLHTYLHDLLLGVVKLNPKKASPGEVREAALFLRDQRERAWEQTHAEAVREALGTGWAVNGIDDTLRALGKGQVRTLLADGQDDDARIDDAVEDALRQRTQVDVLYDEKARRAVDGLAALLRFRR